MIMGYVFRLTLLYGYIRMARFYVSRVGELPNYYSPGERYNEDGGQIGYVPPSTRWWVPSIFRGRTKKRVGKKLKSLAKRLKEQRNYEEELNLLGAAYPEAPNIYAPSSNNLREKALENAKSGKQVLLEQVLNTIRSPADILSGDIKFRRLKRLVDFDMCERKEFSTTKNYANNR